MDFLLISFGGQPTLPCTVPTAATLHLWVPIIVFIIVKNYLPQQRIAPSFYQEDDGHTAQPTCVSCASSCLVDHQGKRSNIIHSLHSTLHKTCNLEE